MDKEQKKVKKYLDTLVELNTLVQNTVNGLPAIDGVDICKIVYPNEVHIHEGIIHLAEVLGLTMTMKPFSCSTYTGCEISFEYKGCTFFQLDDLVPVEKEDM